MTTTTPTDPREAARQSYSGQRMTDTEFQDAYAIAGVLEREIRRSGSFVEARENYAFAYAKGKRISAEQAQNAIGEIFTARHGQSMNQMRETLLANEQKLTKEIATAYAEQVAPLIKDGPTMPFYQALDQVASTMAQDLGVTINAAKSAMSEAQDQLYDLGKDLEAAYHKPVAEAAKAERKQAAVTRKYKPSMG